MSLEVMRQVSLAPRLKYSRRLLESTAADIMEYAHELEGRFSDQEAERTLLFCMEAVRNVDARLRVNNMNDIPHTLPPVVWVLREVSAQLAGHLPECSARLCELAVYLGSITVDAAQLAGVDVKYQGAESRRMLDLAVKNSRGMMRSRHTKLP